MEIRQIRDDEADALGELTVRVYEAIGATDDDYTSSLRWARLRRQPLRVPGDASGRSTTMFGPQLKSPVVLAEAGEASASADDAVAHGMYERMGFVRTPERDWAYSPTVHLRCYVLPL